MDVKDFKDFNEVFSGLRTPSAMATTTLLLVYILPKLNIIPLELGKSAMIVFSTPMIFIYLLEVLINRELKIRNNMILLTALGFLSFIFINASGSLLQTFLNYCISLLLVISIYSVYLFVYSLSQRLYKNPDIRTRFLITVIPTIILIVVFSIGFKAGLHKIADIIISRIRG